MTCEFNTSSTLHSEWKDTEIEATICRKFLIKLARGGEVLTVNQFILLAAFRIHECCYNDDPVRCVQRSGTR